MDTHIHGALIEAAKGLAYLNPAPAIAWPGRPTPQASYWARVTHLRNIPDRPTVDGSVGYDYTGILQIDLMCELGRDEIVYLARAEDALALFPQTLRLVSGPVVVKVYRSYALTGRATGDHWMIPLRVEYRAEAAS